MRFRIGVHLGDVIEKADGTVYGDGVNIAARLQALADVGGILVSDALHGAVRGRVGAVLEEAGEHHVKNIAYALRTFRVVGGAPVTEPPAGSTDTRRGKPSIAVLPFKVLSQQPQFTYLADGLAEDVIALLARVAGFELIAPSSSFAFRNRDAGAASIARDLGVRYIVEGSHGRIQNDILTRSYAISTPCETSTSRWPRAARSSSRRKRAMRWA